MKVRERPDVPTGRVPSRSHAPDHCGCIPRACRSSRTRSASLPGCPLDCVRNHPRAGSDACRERRGAPGRLPGCSGAACTAAVPRDRVRGVRGRPGSRAGCRRGSCGRPDPARRACLSGAGSVGMPAWSSIRRPADGRRGDWHCAGETGSCPWRSPGCRHGGRRRRQVGGGAEAAILLRAFDQRRRRRGPAGRLQPGASRGWQSFHVARDQAGRLPAWGLGAPAGSGAERRDCVAVACGMPDPL